jgi:hypothetical protein
MIKETAQGTVSCILLPNQPYIINFLFVKGPEVGSTSYIENESDIQQ